MASLRNQTIRYVPLARYRYVPTLILLALLATGCGTPYAGPEKDAKDMPDALVPVEIDLGKFDCTIPNSKTNSTILVDFHAFVKLPRYKSYELEEVLQTHDNRFHHHLTLQIRKFDRTALNEPDLMKLRDALRSSLDELLPDNKIEMIGFYSYQFLEE